MDDRVEISASASGDAGETLRYLERRVRDEARAAATATSVKATLIHVLLATAYAKRFGETSASAMSADAWLQEQRVW